MDLGDPAIDWVGLARSMGLSAHRVGHASEIGPAVRAAQESGGPRLVEIPIRGYGDGAP
jgi:thiamine pyrophosphate-dependent acetolactate synthase large subunit-like protein